MEATDKQVQALDAAHRRLLLGATLRELRQGVASLSSELRLKVAEWLPQRAAPVELTIAGRLEGSKVTCKFELYHCRQQGGAGVMGQRSQPGVGAIGENEGLHGSISSIGATAGDDGRDGFREQFHVVFDGLLPDVINIEHDLLLEGNIRATRHLPGAGDAGFGCQAVALLRR